MESVEQNRAAFMPENGAQGESPESKPSKRGGKRPGAGRKPNLAKVLLKGVRKETLAAAVENIDIGAVVVGLLRSRRELIRLQTLNFIFDRMLGKPKQEIGVTGGFIHAHMRDPLLAGLPKEALEALARSYDDVLVKYGLPAAEDGPENQIESKPAIEVQAVESEA